MAAVNVYLTFNGNCKEAFEFYQQKFGREISYIGTFGEMPPMEGAGELDEDDKNRVMHVSLPISAETVLMGSDTMGCMKQPVSFGNNVSVSINTSSKEEADILFQGLSEGGVVTMPIADVFWGAYFGMFTDKFGIHWMVNYDQPVA